MTWRSMAEKSFVKYTNIAAKTKNCAPISIYKALQLHGKYRFFLSDSLISKKTYFISWLDSKRRTNISNSPSWRWKCECCNQRSVHTWGVWPICHHNLLLNQASTCDILTRKTGGKHKLMSLKYKCNLPQWLMITSLFDNWSINRGRSVNKWPVNRGCTVYLVYLVVSYLVSLL